MLRHLLAATAALFVSLPSWADTPIDPAFDRFMAATTGNTSRVTFGGDGTPLGRSAGAGGFAVGSNGAAFYNRSGSIPTKYGPLPVAASQRFSASALARGAGLLVGGPLGLALLAGPYIYDWFQDAGISVDEGGAYRMENELICTQSPARSDFTSGGTEHKFVVGVYNGSCYEEEHVRTEGTPWKVNQRWLVGSPQYNPSKNYLSPEEVGDALDAEPRTSSEIEKILAEGIKYPEITPDPVDTPVVTPTGPTPSKETTKTGVGTDGSEISEWQSCYVIGGIGGVTHEVSLIEKCVKTTTETKPVTLPDGTTATETVTKTNTTTNTDPAVVKDDKADTQPEKFDMPCGVSGTPPCNVKIDETGTSTSVPELANHEDLAKSPFTPYEQLKNSPSTFWPSLPTINWAFTLPTGCGVISVPAFAPYLDSIDICPWQSLFHEIMSVVWVLGGLFGAISTFWRNTFATV